MSTLSLELDQYGVIHQQAYTFVKNEWVFTSNSNIFCGHQEKVFLGKRKLTKSEKRSLTIFTPLMKTVSEKKWKNSTARSPHIEKMKINGKLIPNHHRHYKGLKSLFYKQCSVMPGKDIITDGILMAKGRKDCKPNSKNSCTHPKYGHAYFKKKVGVID